MVMVVRHQGALLWLLRLAMCMLPVAAMDAQAVLTNQRTAWLQASADSIRLDSLSLVPGTLRIYDHRGLLLDSSWYAFEEPWFRWRRIPPADSLEAQWRVLPFSFDDQGQLPESKEALLLPAGIAISAYDNRAGGLSLTSQRGLDYKGAFSRGLSFGNRQDLVLNSAFNLQVQGELGEGIRLQAAIADDNLPIQVEGNTQQLREFDRIFIQLSRNRSQLTAGDYELRQPEGYFMQYFKKLEGATYQTATTDGRWQGRSSIAIARGRFVRQNVVAIEGNQGPYKLSGAQGERFIVVLSGTEKVFIDGVLLERGRDRDYTIDYNQAEITFMPKRLITKDSRIAVEYEYADQQYLRSMYALDTRYIADRWQVYVNIFSQQDSKTATADIRLTPDQRATLRAAGDQPLGILASSVEPVGTQAAQRATYALRDSVLRCGGTDSLLQILVYTTDPEAGKYVATFTFVGEGNGHYVPASEAASNERIFVWVTPGAEDCRPGGSHEPVVRLVAPEQQRMVTAGAEMQDKGGGRWRWELALSQNDRNRFSQLDRVDDLGYAGRFDYNRRYLLQRDSSRWQLDTRAGYEWVHRHFTTLNPYRSPEFFRDWNLASVLGIGQPLPAEEHIAQAEVRLSYPQKGGVSWRTATFQRLGQYAGWQQQGRATWQHAAWSLDAQASHLSSREAVRRTEFWRPSLTVGRTWAALGNWKTRLQWEAEHSQRWSGATDTLEMSSFAFSRLVAEVGSPEREDRGLGFSFRQRRDELPQGSRFVQGPLATEAAVNGQWQPSQQLRLGGVFSWRQLKVENSMDVGGLLAGETTLGRFDLSFQAWKSAIRTNTTYEIGTGQEPSVAFVYVYVGPGLGQYIWLDSLYNADGKIQVNEMEISPFADIADYARVVLLTNDFIRTNNLILNQSLFLEPERYWRQAEGWKKQLAKFSLQSTLTVNRKTQPSTAVQVWNPLQWNLPDSALTAIQLGFRNSLFFNRRHPRFDIQFEHTAQQRRFVQTTGFESQQRTEYTLRVRYNATTALGLRLLGAVGQRQADVELFDNKDYALGFVKGGPELTWQPGKDLRVDLRYAQQKESSRLSTANEGMKRAEIVGELVYQRWLRANLSLIQVDLQADQRSPLAFVLLNGLRPGRNWLWNLTATRQLGELLQLTVGYEGRQTGDARMVHLGRMQVTALF